MAEELEDVRVPLLNGGMSNDDAYRLGKLALDVGRMHVAEGVGDEIDRGLILCRLMKEKGYGIGKCRRRE
jgi:hypothetical protein